MQWLSLIKKLKNFAKIGFKPKGGKYNNIADNKNGISFHEDTGFFLPIKGRGFSILHPPLPYNDHLDFSPAW
jgi:hypothetical protein